MAVVIMPIEQRFRTTLPMPLSSLKCKVSEPSNKITATDKDIIGNNKSPKIASGSTTENTGPNNKPVTKRNKIAGILATQANHCANRAHKPIPAIYNAVI